MKEEDSITTVLIEMEIDFHKCVEITRCRASSRNGAMDALLFSVSETFYESITNHVVEQGYGPSVRTSPKMIENPRVTPSSPNEPPAHPGPRQRHEPRLNRAAPVYRFK